MSARKSGRVLKANAKYFNENFDTGKRKNTAVAKAAAPLPTAVTESVAAATPSTSAATPPTSPPPPPSPPSTTENTSDEEEEEQTESGPLSERQQISIIQKYYTKDSFSGAYAGVQSLKRSLLTEKGLDFPLRVIVKAVHEFPSYVMNLPSIKNYPRSRYVVCARDISKENSLSSQLRCHCRGPALAGRFSIRAEEARLGWLHWLPTLH